MGKVFWLKILARPPLIPLHDSDYNMRQLTYPDDELAAFSGVLSTLSRTFTGGFVWGLPQMFFDVALLWQPFYTLK
jgi:hypothetical protein